MKIVLFLSIKILSICVNFYIFVFSCQAQIKPDNTLIKNTNLKFKNGSIIIGGGTEVGDNLFHSFQDFSINTGEIVHFNNSLNVQNIISRITGNSISNINGLIRNNGQANLFIINPNGIIFGNHATLDIGGSFLGTTADSIQFSNGMEFSSKKHDTGILLKISRPVGLIFTNNSGEIRVQGQGHNINRIANRNFDFINPIDASRFSGLKVKPGNTLALVGGAILLDGGILSTRNGKIQIGSIKNGFIGFKEFGNHLNFNYENKSNNFSRINLTNNALLFINSSEGIGDTINLQGQEINILNGSLVFAQNHGLKTGVVKAHAQNLIIQGSSELALSAIYTSNFGNTPGENIELYTKQIDIQGGQIATTTFTNAASGIININADSLKITGDIPSVANPDGFGGVNTFSYSSGRSGDIIGNIRNILIGLDGNLTTASVSSGTGGDLKVNSENIFLTDGGATLGSITSRIGQGGNVFVKSNYIEISGQSTAFRPSTINSITFGSGNAGNIQIDTSQLLVLDGGGVTSSTLSAGNAGNILINAHDSINILGVNTISKRPSFIISSASLIVDQNLSERFYRIPPYPIGRAGSITLNTKILNITDRAVISVQNDGFTDAGIIQLNANSIKIANQGTISATTAVGTGGDIIINSNILQLNNSSISATAGRKGTIGDGGNIILDTNILVGSNNSSVTANAFEGRGGNIQINTKGLFLSPDSQITASSERGIDGTVQINADTYLNEVSAKPEIILQTPDITSICQGRSNGNSEFLITGTGALAPNPEDLPDIQSTWQRNSHEKISQLTTSTDTTEIVEAQGWVKNPDGSITLTAQANVVNPDATQSANSCNSDKKTTG